MMRDKWVMLHTHEPCYTWISHVTHKSVMSPITLHMNESCPPSCYTWISHVTNRQVTRTNEWVYKCLSSQDARETRDVMHESWYTWMSHVTHDWDMSPIKLHMNESVTNQSSHTHEQANMSVFCMSRCTRDTRWMSNITHEWVILHISGSCHEPVKSQARTNVYVSDC